MAEQPGLTGKVWGFANSNVPTQEIAKQLQLPSIKIQQVAFRLMLMGLVGQVPLLVELLTHEPNLEMSMLGGEERVSTTPTSFSPSFLQNLVEFLKGKT